MSRSEHFLLGAGHGVPFLQQGAADFAARMGQRRPMLAPNTAISPEMTQTIGDAYRAAPAFDDHALPAFHQMRREVKAQFHYLTKPTARGGLGLNVETTAEDPYQKPNGAPDPVSMFRDVVHDRRLKVLSTQASGGHPLFSDEENDMFRAVHDAFGHAGTGRGFDRHGEEAAFQTHASMFSPLARMALATETRGQNSAFNSDPTRSYQKQKIALLPRRLADPRTSFGDMAGAQAQAGRFNEKQFSGLLNALRQSNS